MQIFDSGKGLFHLLFANDDDDYYTDSYVKTNFGFYLYHSLIAMKYDYVYYFYGDDFRNCVIKPFDNVSLELFAEKQPGRSIMNSLFGGKKKNTNESFEQQKNIARTRNRNAGFQINDTTFEETVSRLTELMKKKSRIAVVMPIGIFNALADCQNVIGELKKISEKNYHDNNRHAFIITASLYANESLRYFKPSDETESNIFTNTELFPELESYFYDYYQFSSNYYIYDKLKRLIGDEMAFYDSLSFENIRRMVTRYCLNTDYVPDFSVKNIHSLTAVIYAYYNSAEYRSTHHISLPDNPKRLTGAVEESMRNDRNLRTQLREAAHEFDGHSNIYKYVCNIYPDCIESENEAYMLGSPEHTTETDMLLRIRNIYRSRCEKLHPGLEKVIAYMNKPCVEATVSFSAENFRKKVIEFTNDNLFDEMSGEFNEMLLGHTIKALEYYFNYFQLSSAVSEDMTMAWDESFNLYKNVIYIIKKLGDEIKSRDDLKRKIAFLEERGTNDELLGAYKKSLEGKETFVQQLEKSVENAERLLSLTIADDSAGEIIRNMRTAAKNIVNLKTTTPRQ